MAYQKLEKYRCGYCGNENYSLYKEEDRDDRLISECIECKCTTIITLATPKLELGWGTGDGIMAIF